MAGWESNTRERLERAALALFAERGHDSMTVPEIADRAGLTKSTFFRHYADKRGVLFGGQDALARRFNDAISATSPSATIGACLAAAELGVLAFSTTLEHWAAPENRRPYTEIAHAALRELQACAAAIAGDADVRT
ncbi:TetR/AcrR family transcriptional regulator [Nonomuraea lactucae]|uniref:TetR/AcrR family transcriptional regulator n=1 Tax=Nonomuraea lactucae TaxID=2249762 RepID=UPI000DE2F38E|nr:helix-turn-helix domain-containing protein [Nonomuraea lactucae]